MSRLRLNENFLKKFERYDFSKIKEERIFLVGSITNAKEYFYEIETILQISYNKIVSICSVDGLLHKKQFSQNEWNKLQKIAMKKLHSQDAVLVLDKGNYIGEQSKEEIEYFQKKFNKPVYYLSKLKRFT